MSNINFLDEKNNVLVNNQHLLTMCNEKLLVYLCVHGSKHLFERIEWINDVHKFIESQNINWDRVEEIIHNTNYKSFFFLGLSLSSSIFGTKIPANMTKSFNDNKISTTKEYIIYRLNLGKITIFKNKIKYMLNLFDSNSDKLMYIHKRYFKPSLVEYEYVKLPKYFYFFYYILRQYLLFKEYVFKVSK